MSEKKMVFDIVSSGRDEYPGDGLRLVTKNDKRLGTNGYDGIDKHFLSIMGVEVQDGDEIEVTVRIKSRVVIRREPV